MRLGAPWSKAVFPNYSRVQRGTTVRGRILQWGATHWFGGCIALLIAGHAVAPSAATSSGAVIHTEDVERFYKVYEAAGGHPSAAQLQHDYLDPGSEGLHVFASARNVTGATIADTLTKRPEIYADARRCLAVLPQVRRRVELALHELGRLYPEASFPPVTIAVGRGKPVGMTKNSSGVQIGLEALCATDWLNPDVEDRFVLVIAHEYGHIEQLPAIADDDHPTVLAASLIEGGAEFTAELIAGAVSNAQLGAEARGREKETEEAFVADEDKTDLSAWLYNSSPTQPRDLGYWVGYRIVKSYYQHTADKRQALRDIYGMTDPHQFLAKSGWYPGIQLD